jgi:hypothetical protein
LYDISYKYDDDIKENYEYRRSKASFGAVNRALGNKPRQDIILALYKGVALPTLLY